MAYPVKFIFPLQMTHLMSATTSRANLNGEEGANIRMEMIEAVLYNISIQYMKAYN